MAEVNPWGAPPPWLAPEPEKKPEPAPWGAPLGSDGWQTSPPLPPSGAVAPWPVHDEIDMSTKREYVEGPDAWPVDPEKAGSADWSGFGAAVRDSEEEPDIADVLKGAGFSIAFDTKGMTTEQRARVVQSLAGDDTPMSVERDGELTVIEPATSDEPVSYYAAYRHSMLYTILAGPYDSEQQAGDACLKAYAMMTSDDAFKLAFENKFHSMGLYVAEIPTSAKRKGAYGVL